MKLIMLECEVFVWYCFKLYRCSFCFLRVYRLIGKDRGKERVGRFYVIIYGCRI